MSKITVEELNERMKEARALKEAKEEAEETAETVGKAYRAKLAEIQEALDAHNLKSFKNEWGNAVRQRRWSCSVPKEPKARAEFFEWMKKEGYFEGWITVHSQTLNSEYKKLYEEHAKRGELFEIPGVGAPNVVETVTLRSK